MNFSSLDTFREYVFLYFEYIRNDAVTEGSFYLKPLQLYLSGLQLDIDKDELSDIVMKSYDAYSFYNVILLKIKK